MRPIGPADKAATNKLRRCGGKGATDARCQRLPCFLGLSYDGYCEDNYTGTLILCFWVIKQQRAFHNEGFAAKKARKKETIGFTFSFFLLLLLLLLFSQEAFSRDNGTVPYSTYILQSAARKARKMKRRANQSVVLSGGGGSRAKKTFPSAAIAWHHWHSVLQRVWWYNTIVLRLSFSCSLPPLPSPSCYCTPANGRSDRKKRTDTKKV